MTVAKLIELLQKADQNAQVIVPKSHGFDLASRYMPAKDAHRTAYGILIL